MGTYEVLPRASAPPKRALFLEKCRSLLHQLLSFDHPGFFRSCPRQGQNMTKSRILCTCFYRLLVTFWLRGMWCSLRSPFRWCRKLEPLGNNTIPSNCIQFCPMVSNCIQFFPIIQLWEARFFFLQWIHILRLLMIRNIMLNCRRQNTWSSKMTTWIVSAAMAIESPILLVDLLQELSEERAWQEVKSEMPSCCPLNRSTMFWISVAQFWFGVWKGFFWLTHKPKDSCQTRNEWSMFIVPPFLL